ncbi:MAG: uridine kinase [Candidatus Krumholzibacteria bacterium]|nr:uridine kinase [Candidatus Krumholzibacteria bacterium]
MIIGIAGGSCSGKSSIAMALAGMIRGRPVFVLGLDSYYLDLKDLEPEAKKLHNFDEPASLDIPLLVGDLKTLVAGGEVPIPIYDFETHTRLPEDRWVRISVDDMAIIVVEGLFTLSIPEIRKLLDVKVFIDVSHETCLQRRIARDIDERGRTRESVIRQYERTVQPMFELHVLPGREHADLIVDGKDPAGESAGKILRII